jgi:hypothetical protein
LLYCNIKPMVLSSAGTRGLTHRTACWTGSFLMGRQSSFFVIALHALGKACGTRQELPMSVSAILLECSVECARLARQCRDDRTAAALFAVSERLHSAATRDAELLADAEPASDTGLPSPALAAAGRK